jgi:hypothetical protein
MHPKPLLLTFLCDNLIKYYPNYYVIDLQVILQLPNVFEINNHRRRLPLVTQKYIFSYIK